MNGGYAIGDYQYSIGSDQLNIMLNTDIQIKDSMYDLDPEFDFSCYLTTEDVDSLEPLPSDIAYFGYDNKTFSFKTNEEENIDDWYFYCWAMSD